MKKAKIARRLIIGREVNIKKAANLAANYAALKFGRTKLPGYPSIMMIEPTNICNLHCPLCPTGNGSIKAPRGFMQLKQFKSVIDRCGDYLINVTLWNWGEPFLNKHVLDMIEYAKSKRIFVRVSTNGHLLKDAKNMDRIVRSGIDELIFSLDGASRETFLKYRKSGDFDAVIGNLKRLVETKRRLHSTTPFIELQFIVMRHNEHEVESIRKIAGEIGVDAIKLKTVSLESTNALAFGGDRGKISGYKPLNEKYSRYTTGMKRKSLKNRCVRLWLTSVINWDGSVSPCCNDPNRVFDMGNVFKEDFMDIWNGPKYQAFRKAVLKNKSSVAMCRNCSGDLMGLDVE